MAENTSHHVVAGISRGLGPMKRKPFSPHKSSLEGDPK